MLFGELHEWVIGVSAIVGASVATAARLSVGAIEFWRLGSHGRRRVRDVQMSGVPAHDTTIDRIALDRQRRFAQWDTTGGQAMNAVLLVVLAVPPVILLLRGASPWWLATETATLALALHSALLLMFPSPRARLEILIDNLSTDPT